MVVLHRVFFLKLFFKFIERGDWSTLRFLNSLTKLFRYFKEHGWPSSTIFETPPDSDNDREKLIDIIQVEFPCLICVYILAICLEFFVQFRESKIIFSK